MSVIEGAVSASAGVASMAVSGGLQFLGKGGTKGLGKVGKVFDAMEYERLHLSLFLAGGVGIAGTGLGRAINSAVTWCDDKVSGFLTEWVGQGVGWLVAGGALVLLIKRFKDNEAGPIGLGLALAVPNVVGVIPGDVGHAVASGVGWLGGTTGGLIGSAFGIN
ncbi:hypothetical protein ABZW10_32980 [Kitasatospora sp. NPDC004723]|uniref:hypothetical protein n=1 Tax=Kitasatospora sp. NPDC004723 TaxID=3154288 RepID=UPI0033AB3D32